MMPCSGLLLIQIKHPNEMGTSEFALNQHHVGGHSADHGPKHAPGVISDEGGSDSRTVQTDLNIKPAFGRHIPHAQNRLTGTAPLPKSGAPTCGGTCLPLTGCSRIVPSCLRAETNRPISRQEFEARFPDDAACARHLVERRWPDGFVCPVCRARKGWALTHDRPAWECAGCRRIDDLLERYEAMLANCAEMRSGLSGLLKIGYYAR